MNNATPRVPNHLTLGIEFGSTRIKAVLIGPDHKVVASGAHDWQNQMVDGYWSYSMAAVIGGMQEAYAALAEEFYQTYGVKLTKIDAMGVSAMMHGYLPFDKDGNQLAEFRSWRNTTTGQAASELTALFNYNIPHRWSVAHIYQAILNGEDHVTKIDFLTTMEGYVHWKLTGQKVLGRGEAAGMFPLTLEADAYNPKMLEDFNAILDKHGMPYHIEQILPGILNAGECAGYLTEEGAKILDPTGTLQPGTMVCPPEGDADTGMVATNAITPRTGNVSAGTSIFAMIVLEKPLSKVYPEIDPVLTPDGTPVAMVHCNTCTSDLDAWVRLFGEVAEAAGAKLDKNALYRMFYHKALEADPDCGGLVSYNYFASEPITALEDGRPLFMRRPDAKMTLPNFARAQIYAAMATLKLGMRILEDEQVRIDSLLGHGGMFKVPGVGQKLMASALNMPISVMETAGEGGPWGIALLAAYMAHKEEGETLVDYLNNKVFADAAGSTAQPDPVTREGFMRFLADYEKGLAAERAAVEALV